MWESSCKIGRINHLLRLHLLEEWMKVRENFDSKKIFILLPYVRIIVGKRPIVKQLIPIIPQDTRIILDGKISLLCRKQVRLQGIYARDVAFPELNKAMKIQYCLSNLIKHNCGDN